MQTLTFDVARETYLALQPLMPATPRPVVPRRVSGRDLSSRDQHP